jgi:hypothetical protein
VRLARLDEWLAVLRRERRTVSAMAILGALASGGVQAATWRRRIRTCMTCPIYDRRTKACRSPFPAYRHLGCGCYVPFLARTKEPYPNGCWGRAVMGPPFGWGADREDDPPVV